MLATNGPRLWDSLMAMAEIGATANGGSSRLALTEADAAGRALFAQWAEAAGLAVHHDAVGNQFARRAGAEAVPPVVLGSHLDTQPRGGRFDGVLGRLFGFEDEIGDHHARREDPVAHPERNHLRVVVHPGEREQHPGA